MESFNLRMLFWYRFLAELGQLDGDLAAADQPPTRPARWTGPGHQILVDQHRCIGCFACRSACPPGVLHIWHVAQVTDPIACLSCAEAPCLSSCPVGALADHPIPRADW